MKGYYRHILPAMAVLLMTAACTKNPAHNERETDEITFKFSAPVTRAMFSEDKRRATESRSMTSIQVESISMI